jgi:hypothetical protein
MTKSWIPKRPQKLQSNFLNFYHGSSSIASTKKIVNYVLHFQTILKCCNKHYFRIKNGFIEIKIKYFNDIIIVCISVFAFDFVVVVVAAFAFGVCCSTLKLTSNNNKIQFF